MFKLRCKYMNDSMCLIQLLMEMRERVRDLEIGKLFYPSP